VYSEIIILQVTNTNTRRIPPKGAFQTPICAKEQRRRPQKHFKQGETPRGTDPCPAQSPPHKGGGEMAWSGAGRSPAGASRPLLPLAVAWTHAEVVHHVSPYQR
jgi:hypothetical protein